MQNDIPLLKEYRLEKITHYLGCIDKFNLNREGQRNCIYELYKMQYDKPIESFDKAVFRGMVIPTLNYLGFLSGTGQFIRVSANGKLIVESKKISNILHEKVLTTLIYELDETTFHFIDKLQKSSNITTTKFSENIDLPGISIKQRFERTNKWLTILKQTNLIYLSKNDEISVSQENVESTKKSLNSKDIDFHMFEKILVRTFFNMSIKRAGIFEIEELRSKVSEKFLEMGKVIITERMFDELLSALMDRPGHYTISLGKPMGRQEKLFKYKENYFKTLHIERDQG
jgi:hypothetical protein